MLKTWIRLHPSEHSKPNQLNKHDECKFLLTKKRLPIQKAAVTLQRHSNHDSTHSYAPFPAEGRSCEFNLSYILLKTPFGITASYTYCSLMCIRCQTSVKFCICCSLSSLCRLEFIERLTDRPRSSVVRDSLHEHL